MTSVPTWMKPTRPLTVETWWLAPVVSPYRPREWTTSPRSPGPLVRPSPASNSPRSPSIVTSPRSTPTASSPPTAARPSPPLLGLRVAVTVTDTPAAGSPNWPTLMTRNCCLVVLSPSTAPTSNWNALFTVVGVNSGFDRVTRTSSPSASW
jgi:hypothetical protein